jgi:D-glycero-alpha-D-manno-heptose-7-phosphate kinase
MIISKAPLRISLAGGGSDLPSYFQEDEGKVLALTIDKYVYLAIHDFFAGGIRVAYSLVEQVSQPNDINHPIFRETMKLLNFNESIEIGSFADVPSNGTGLGSSSAFTNALIAGLMRFRLEEFTPQEVAELATIVEIEKCHQPIGKQDQWSTALGGINLINFHNDGSVTSDKIQIKAKNSDPIDSSLRLFYLGFGRSAGNILREQNRKFSRQGVERNIQREIVQLVGPMSKALENSNIAEIGELLHLGWDLKRRLSNDVSSDSIDRVYELALSSGALGGKVVGAGGGGFLLLCVPEENKVRFDAGFTGFRELKFNLSFTGVTIAFDDRRF